MVAPAPHSRQSGVSSTRKVSVGKTIGQRTHNTVRLFRRTGRKQGSLVLTLVHTALKPWWYKTEVGREAELESHRECARPRATGCFAAVSIRLNPALGLTTTEHERKDMIISCCFGRFVHAVPAWRLRVVHSWVSTRSGRAPTT